MRFPLAVVFFASNMARSPVLCLANPGPLPFRHHTVRLRPIFHLIDMLLLFIQTVRFSLIQLPALDSLIDPLLRASRTFVASACGWA